MRFPLGWLATTLLVPALLGATSSTRAEDAPVPTELTFLADLDRAKANIAQPAVAMKMLLDSLEANRGRDYAFGKRVAIEDLVRRILFRRDCPPPEPQSVVKGKLRKFVSATGALEIAYMSDKPTDFEVKSDGSLFFPVHFRGAYTITVKGDSYPSETTSVPVIEVGASEDPKTKKSRAWVIGYGIPPLVDVGRTAWVPPRIVYVCGDEKKVMAQLPAHPSTAGRPYRLDASVSSTRVTGSIDGKSIGSAPKTDGEYGIALISVAGWREIVISGLVEPSWIQGKLDAITDPKRKAFDAAFDPKNVLPAWLLERPKGPIAPAPNRAPLPSALEALTPELVESYADATTKLASGDPAGALAVVESMRTRGAPDAATAVLAAQALWKLDEPTRALAEVSKVITPDGGPLDALLLEARILVRLGRDEALGKTLDAIRAHADSGTDVLEAVATLDLLAGRLDDARRLSEDAARRGVRSRGLEQIARATVRAQNGPEWPKTYEYKTSNYHVMSDIDADTCRKAAEALEDALVDFRGSVHPLRPEPRRQYRIYLFSGRVGFDTYTSDSLSLVGTLPEHVAGFYSPIFKQLLIWNLPDRDEMMRVVRHEGFHQYLDRLLPDPPVRFNEGFAVYFEGMKRIGGTLQTNAVRDDLVRALKSTSLIPMADFVEITPARFYADAKRCYPQAWLVAHLLRHGAPRHAELYRAFLSRLETMAGSEAVRATFDAATLRALDADLAAHLRELSTGK